jgi:hypothetical protein
VLLIFVDRVAIVFFPSEHSRSVGWVFLLGSSALRVITLHRRIKYLAVLFCLRGLERHRFDTKCSSHRITVHSGLATNGLLATAFCIAGAALSFTFNERTLHPIDRIAVLMLGFEFAHGAVYDSDGSGAVRGAVPHELVSFVLMGIGLCALFVAWAYARYRRRAVDPSVHTASPNA